MTKQELLHILTLVREYGAVLGNLTGCEDQEQATQMSKDADEVFNEIDGALMRHVEQ